LTAMATPIMPSPCWPSGASWLRAAENPYPPIQTEPVPDIRRHFASFIANCALLMLPTQQ
jgi:hypothetical protein